MSSVKTLSPEELASLSPSDFRQLVRQDLWDRDPASCQYYCNGYTQHGLTILPLEYAFEYLVFCLRNPRAFYVADVCDPGSPHPSFLAPEADVRTDCGSYLIFKNGELAEEVTNIKEYWRDDLVAIFTASLHGATQLLHNRGVKFREMGAFTSNIKATPSGRFECDNMVVAAILFATPLDAIRAIQVFSQIPVQHGYPIHMGEPSEIGIDLMQPDVWNPHSPDSPPLPPQPGEICLYWVGSVSGMYALKDAKLPLAILVKPGNPFVSDRRTEEFSTLFRT